MTSKNNHAYRQYGRVLHCDVATSNVLIAAAGGEYSVFRCAAKDAEHLRVSTQVHGPLAVVGPVTLTLVGAQSRVVLEGLTGQVSKGDAYSCFLENAPNRVAG